MSDAGRKIPKPIKLSQGIWESLTTDPPIYIPTPLDGLNEIITGLPEGELILVAGRPSQGKTALAMQMIEHAASLGMAGGVFSMEMSRRALAQRIVLSRARIDGNRYKARAKLPLTEDELARLKEANDYLETLPIYVDDTPGLRSDQMYERAVSWKKEFDIKIIMQDYIQLAEGDGDNRQEIVGKVGRDMKIIARELSIPVVALSQLNSGNEKENRRPRMSDLRDSGQLEQTADTILMFSYPNSPEDELDQIREAEIHIVKQRNGPTGIAVAQFNKPMTRFENLTEETVELASEKVAKAKAEKPKPSGGKTLTLLEKMKQQNQVQEEPS